MIQGASGTQLCGQLPGAAAAQACVVQQPEGQPSGGIIIRRRCRHRIRSGRLSGCCRCISSTCRGATCMSGGEAMFQVTLTCRMSYSRCALTGLCSGMQRWSSTASSCRMRTDAGSCARRHQRKQSTLSWHQQRDHCHCRGNSFAGCFKLHTWRCQGLCTLANRSPASSRKRETRVDAALMQLKTLIHKRPAGLPHPKLKAGVVSSRHG